MNGEEDEGEEEDEVGDGKEESLMVGREKPLEK